MFSEGNHSGSELFDGLRLSSFDCLQGDTRNVCPQCNRKRKYFCYDCFVVTVPQAEKVPSVSLPCELVMLESVYNVTTTNKKQISPSS